MNDRCTSPPSVPVRILLVDDFEPWRNSLCLMLKRHERFHIVGEAADGLAAVQITLELKPDLILLDIGLPRLNGFEAASRIRQIAPDTKIIFLTQINDADVASAVLSDRAHGYVVKQNVGRDLVSAIEGVLNAPRKRPR